MESMESQISNQHQENNGEHCRLKWEKQSHQETHLLICSKHHLCSIWKHHIRSIGKHHLCSKHHLWKPNRWSMSVWSPYATFIWFDFVDLVLHLFDLVRFSSSLLFFCLIFVGVREEHICSIWGFISSSILICSILGVVRFFHPQFWFV